jgi:predicted ATPase
VVLKGFKSIKAMDLELRPLNVLIGENGAGKSNLITFFTMLHEMMAGRLQQYIGTTGHAHSLLHFGPKHTQEIQARLEFKPVPWLEGERAVDAYVMRLAHAAPDSLVFVEEKLEHADDPYSSREFPLGSGHQETGIGKPIHTSMPIVGQLAPVLRDLLTGCGVYHFHDTSLTARVRKYGYAGDNRALLPDAGNLAAFLLRHRRESAAVYQRIISTIRLIAPFFDDFQLEPPRTESEVILNWRDKGSDQVFGPHQLSDGTLRAICLITLLMQPEKELPNLIIVDEPELGLHPYALNVVGALFKKAAHHTQILISTQSSSFLDNFDAEDVIVVNRDGEASQFIRPDAAKLKAWLDEYSLGEIWEKNVMGGGPH